MIPNMAELAVLISTFDINKKSKTNGRNQDIKHLITTMDTQKNIHQTISANPH